MGGDIHVAEGLDRNMQVHVLEKRSSKCAANQNLLAVSINARRKKFSLKLGKSRLLARRISQSSIDVVFERALGVWV